MQIAQAVSFIIFSTVQVKNHVIATISFSLLLTTMVIVPLLSVAHWIWAA